MASPREAAPCPSDAAPRSRGRDEEGSPPHAMGPKPKRVRFMEDVEMNAEMAETTPSEAPRSLARLHDADDEGGNKPPKRTRRSGTPVPRRVRLSSQVNGDAWREVVSMPRPSKLHIDRAKMDTCERSALEWVLWRRVARPDAQTSRARARSESPRSRVWGK